MAVHSSQNTNHVFTNLIGIAAHSNACSTVCNIMARDFHVLKKNVNVYDAIVVVLVVVVIIIAASRHLFINLKSVGRTQQSTQILWVFSISNPSKSARIFCSSSHFSSSSAVSTACRPFTPRAIRSCANDWITFGINGCFIWIKMSCESGCIWVREFLGRFSLSLSDWSNKRLSLV